ncbi:MULTISPECIES: type I-B CRISPR-associated protein Cas5b [unclassified Clostridium]|uniref:type I-B CRISPR-associated protein Cas5b n=1 Tax=unclassified Clostridium TaxID=2614128 RepID=UPI0013FAEB0B|nr:MULTISPECIES: type I-B CRISPR-associated protein Cas5b [unclassified Clostridium]MBN1052291.1 type I-B CRISPR-associated protein Cas5 [Clostridium botulinum]NFR87881.1 type I-B CRISPR-associated protein Cas5 [Clostridium botulinum]NFR90721.1 type I-B CRISPR-associated protein Cas5 [Clostridium botulinum]
MKVLRFKLSGKTAFFKKPDVNTYLYFTYGNIHKVALLGIFGAVIGYGGYNQMKLKEELSEKKKKDEVKINFPEFYEKLKSLKLSIVPNNEKGFIPKKVQCFNNSVGYASKEQGGNLIVKEQWLENPSWDIYVLIENEESQKIADNLINHKVIYAPYLGKNDHYADISNVELMDTGSILEESNINKINCIFPKEYFKVVLNYEDEYEEDEDDIYEETFKYEEKLPVSLSEDTNMYKLKSFLYTNMKVCSESKCTVYKIENKNIVFY